MNRTTQKVSCYQILQVASHASDEEIKRAYRKLALRHHPDRNPKNRHLAELRFRLITEAYAKIKTADKRAQYDLSLRPKNDNRPNPGWFDQLLTDIFGPVKKAESTRV